MTKRLIDIDDELLDGAGDALGTKGIADTVRGALRGRGDRLRAEVDRATGITLSGPAGAAVPARAA